MTAYAALGTWGDSSPRLKSNAVPSIRARFIEKRTYLRPLDEDGTRFETPRQALDRVMGHQRYLWEQALGRPLNDAETAELAELRSLIEAKKVSMSGRVKWMGGTDIIKERASAAFNCLGVETRFITDRGVKSFADFNDGDEVMVWTHKGRWRSAIVKNYGKQQLNRLTLRRSARATVEVRATGNHRWILSSGKETTDFRVGDRLLAPVSDFYDWSWNNAPVDEKSWWAYGYVYGDGTITRNGSRVESGSMVRLCGRDKEVFLPRFIELGFGYSFPPSCNADPIVYTGHYMKTLPADDSEVRLVRAFIRGYLDADGARRNANENARRDEFHRILATSDEAQNFIQKWFPAVGLFVSAVADASNETNFGTRSNAAKWFSFYGDAGAATNGSTYKLNEIAEDAFEDVWCLEVEEDRSFTLANGIVTGNCSFTIAETPADLVDIFWLLLQGCGVGFRPKPGLLTGLPASIRTIEYVGSTRTDKGGQDETTEIIDPATSTWTIKVGDSAKGWAKALGKLTTEKPRVERLVIDLSELRPGGKRLRGYGWLSSGWEPLQRGFRIILDVLTRKADQPLDAIDIGDIVNALGTVLSSRRSAQIWLYETRATTWAEFDDELLRFVDAKTDRFTYHREDGTVWNPPADFDWSAKNAIETLRALAEKAGATNKVHREQSNNSIVFNAKPERAVIVELLKRILDTGEPGFVNGAAARRRAPEMEGLNPCVTADTWVLTSEGPRQVRELIDVPHRSIVHGKPYQATGFWKSGHKKVFNLKTEDGFSLRLTEDHKVLVETSRKQSKKGGYDVTQAWIEAKDLKPGDRVVLGDNRTFAWGAQDEFDKGWLVGEVVGDGAYSEDGKYHAKVQFWGENARGMAERAHALVEALPLDYHQPVVSHGPVYSKAHDSWLVHSKRLTDLCAVYMDEAKTLNERVEKASSSFIRGVLCGWFDADGTVIGSVEKGRSIRLCSTHLENLKTAQRMLAHLGIIGRIYENRRTAGARMMPDGKGGLSSYECQATHELIITKSNMQRFADVIGFTDPAKKQRLADLLAMNTRGEYQERFTSKVESVEFDGMEDVYDCTVDDVHRFSANGIIVHNCAEILLPSKGFCNLVQVVWHRFNGDFEGLCRAQYLAGRANYRQTCVSMRDGVLQLQWNDNQRLLRLCGVSPTGYVAWEGIKDPILHERAAAAARHGANSMADDLGLPRSRRVTQCQPAGTSSKVMGLEGDEVHEGAHVSPSRFIFNHVNFSKYDRIVAVLQAAGYTTFPNPSDPTGILVRFPVAYPDAPYYQKVDKEIDGRIETLEVSVESAIDQLERYRMLMNHYVDHNCFSPRTKFVTREHGLVPFSNFSHGDEVHVLGKGGRWRKATVKNFGRQEIYEVTFRRGVTTMTVETTAGHRWPTTNANARYQNAEPKFLTTADLTGFSGDMVNNYVAENPELSLEGIAHGIVYGDGTLTRTGSCQVFLCDGGKASADKRSLARYFEALGFRSIEHPDKGQVRIHGLPSHWKSLPETDDPAYLRGFFAGWFATDGNVSASPMIATKDREALVWARQMAPIAGLSTSTVIGKRDSVGFGGELSTYYVLGLIGLTTSDAFYLLPEKSRFFTQSKHWKVVQVKPTGRYEDVWCVEEPEHHLFTLDGDLLTSNCSITVSFDADEIEAMADWFMAHWDEYVGVSFLKRNDPTRSAADLGFLYLPQEAVSKRMYEEYVASLMPVALDEDDSDQMLDIEACLTGACPVR